MYRRVRLIDGVPLLLLDAGIVVTAYLLGLFGGFEGHVPSDRFAPLLWTCVALPLLIHLAVNRAVGLYGPVWRFASVEEALRIFVAVAVGAMTSALAISVIAQTIDLTLPAISTPGLAALVILIGSGGIRFQARLFSIEREHIRSGRGTRTIVVGAKETGVTLASELDTDATIDVIGFVDDDPALDGRSIRGRRVLGTTDDLESICAELRIERIVVALPGESTEELRPLLARAMRTDAQVQVLASSGQRASSGALIGSVRDLDLDDLLRRDHPPIDLDEVSQWLRGAVVLITGAGGSIGSEIARQAHQFGPRRLLLLDRDETLLHELVTSDVPGGTQLLVDIRDERSVERVFSEYKPDVVFHAAALKHVPILEANPIEAIRTNVLATWRMATLAADSGCRRFVSISTDKAANPCSVMGATKRAAELAVKAVARQNDVPFTSVRFGNVLGSRGSVVPTFLKQILAGGPVTITDPDMTRYFMSVPEAVSLVLQAGYQASDDQTFLLDMGAPVPIVHLANHLIRLAGLRPGADVSIEVTGRRAGERLHEQLFDEAESVRPTQHPSIRSLHPRVHSDHESITGLLDYLEQVCERGSHDAAAQLLQQLLRQHGVPCQLDRPTSHVIDVGGRNSVSGVVRRPALLGGARAFETSLPFARPARPPLESVVRRLSTSYGQGILTNGPLVRELEERAADLLGVRHVIAVSSCTSGLMLTVQALTEGRGGGVVMPSFTFTASAHAVMWNRRQPIFAECDPRGFQLDLVDAAARSDNASMVLATHVAGGPCKPELVEAMARENGLAVAFDAAHAFGSQRKGRKIGTFGDAEVFSLTPTKVLVGGEGGLVATDRDDLGARLRAGRDYGNTGDYDPRFVGLNARMSEFHAATALASLEVFDASLARRRTLAKRYIDGLEGLSGVHVQSVDADDRSTYKDLSVTVQDDLGLTRNQLLAVLAAEGIETRCYFSPPVHRQKAYADLPLTHLPVTDDVSSRVVSLPIYPDMSDHDVDLVVEVLWSAQAHAGELDAASADASSRRHHPTSRPAVGPRQPTPATTGTLDVIPAP